MSEKYNPQPVPISLAENISQLVRNNKLLVTPDELLELPTGTTFKSLFTAAGYTGLKMKDSITREVSYGLDITRRRFVQEGTIYKVIFRGMPSEIEFMTSPGKRFIGNIESPITLLHHWHLPKGKYMGGAASESPIGFFDLSLDPNLSGLLSHISVAPFENIEP